MTNLPNIKLSKHDLKRLLDKSFFNYGGESIILKSPSQNTLYKIFTSNKKVIEMSENKEKKIMRLHELSLEESTKPLSTISLNGTLIGYEMTYDKDDIPTYVGKFTRVERIKFLQETRRILEYFASKDIIYGDVAYRNILFNKKTHQFKFCDMDNAQLEDYPIDLIGTTTDLGNYNTICGITSKTDAYMHNILSLTTLGIDFPHYFDEEIDYEFNHPARIIIDSMKEPKTFTGEYITEYVKKKI